ncbi:MAG: rod shape-determining protein MreD [Clostridiales bacterium]|nr:rod shape-determining protein MreD [Clostridiales bacterium]
MLNVIVTAVVLIVNFIIQSTVLQFIEIRGVIPDTMITIIVSYALLRGQNCGMAVGFAAGMIYDIFFGNSLGFYALLCMLIGYFCGICHRNFYRENYVLPVTLSAASCMIMGLVIYVTGFLLQNNYNVFYFLFSVIVPQTVYTGIAAIVVYRILYSINNRIEKKEKEKRRLF